MTGNKRKASCGCGALTVEAAGEPFAVYVCACRDSQRGSGSCFTYVALYKPEAVSIGGERKVFRQFGDSGRWNEYNFCPNCGTRVFATGEGSDDIGISAGCFGESSFPKPTNIYWISRQHDRVAFPPDAVRHDKQPG